MDSINRLHGRKTLIIIAHRLQTIEKCDMVYRVENGQANTKVRFVQYANSTDTTHAKAVAAITIGTFSVSAPNAHAARA